MTLAVRLTHDRRSAHKVGSLCIGRQSEVMIYKQVVDAMGMPFALVYVAMLLGFMYFAFVSIPKTLKTKSWPKTAGKVVSSDLYEAKRLTKNGGSIIVYSADIKYMYNVNGEEYSSKKIKWVDHNSNNKTHHQKKVDTYAKGQVVEVFYNPKKPSVGLLEPGFGTGNFIALIFFVLGLGSMTLLLSTKL